MSIKTGSQFYGKDATPGSLSIEERNIAIKNLISGMQVTPEKQKLIELETRNVPENKPNNSKQLWSYFQLKGFHQQQ